MFGRVVRYKVGRHSPTQQLTNSPTSQPSHVGTLQPSKPVTTSDRATHAQRSLSIFTLAARGERCSKPQASCASRYADSSKMLLRSSHRAHQDTPAKSTLRDSQKRTKALYKPHRSQRRKAASQGHERGDQEEGVVGLDRGARGRRDLSRGHSVGLFRGPSLDRGPKGPPNGMVNVYTGRTGQQNGIGEGSERPDLHRSRTAPPPVHRIAHLPIDERRWMDIRP